MKIRKITPIFLLASAMLLAACGPSTSSDSSTKGPDSSSISSEEPPVVHTATFKNGETILATYSVNHGGYATYAGETPTRASTAAETYTFSGWDKDPATTPIVEDTIFNAQFESAPVQYTVTFKNGDAVLATYQVNYGEYATYDGATPTKDATAAETYTFSGWDKDPATTPIVEDTVFTAQFDTAPVQYTATFKNGDAVLATYQVNYGEYATYDGATPTKDATAAETYTFSGWDKDPAKTPIVENTVFTAQFSTAPVQYTATFKNGDAVLATYNVNYGEYAVYAGAVPTKDSTGSSEYDFAGWDKDPAATPIVEDTVFTAQFNELSKNFVVEDFESYETSNDLADEWEVKKYSDGTGWVSTTATISLSAKAPKDGGKQAGQLNYWLNTTGFKYSKAIAPSNVAANAVKFTFKGHEGDSSAITFRMEGEASVGGNKLTPYFDYKFVLDNDSYVTYTIPFADTKWTSNYDSGLSISGDSINVLCNNYGFASNRLANIMKSVAFMVKGQTPNGSSTIGYLDNVEFVNTTATSATKVYEIDMQPVYTGYLADGTTVAKLSLNADKTARFETLNLETNLVVPGTVNLDGQALKFTSADQGASLVYNALVKTEGKALKFVSGAGTYGAQVTNLNMTAVDTLDNFDSYANTGTPYYQSQNDPSKRSGMHTGWFMDYYSGGSGSPVGGTGWSLMGGDGSQLKLKTDGGHSGSNYACMKHGTAGAMRYMTWGLSDGSATAHSGKTLSFYAKQSGDYAFNLYVYAYYQQQVTPSTQQNNRTESGKIVMAKTDTEWTHYTVTLDASKTYYGVSFLLKEGSGTSYLYVDDIEIYSADPRAEFTPAPVVETLPAGAKFSGVVNEKTTYLNIGEDGNVSLDATSLGLGTVNGTISAIEDNKVTVSLPGAATFVASLDEDRYTMSVESATGTYAALFNNGKFYRVYLIDNFDSYAANGNPYYQGQTDPSKRSGIYTGWFADYYSGGSGSPVGGTGWSLMGGDGSQIKLKTDGGHSGNNYATMKANSNSMRYMTWGLSDGSATAMRGNTLSFWMKSKGSAKTTVNVYVYYQQQVTPSTQQLNRVQYTATLETTDTNWAEYKVVLNQSLSFYGLSILPKTSGTENWIYVDDIEIRTEELSIPTTMSFTGKVQGQDCTATFNPDKTCTLDLRNLGMPNVLNGTYTISASSITATFEDGSSFVALIGNLGNSLKVLSGTSLGAYAIGIVFNSAA